MIAFAYPWLLLVALLPLVLRFILPPYREAREALRVPFLERLEALTGRRASGGAVVPFVPWFQRVQIIVCWLLSVVALARPQWVGDPIVKTLASRDLLLAVDLSGSMDSTDLSDADGRPVRRLDAVKRVLDDFLTRRSGDRVGLIVFGSAPFVQVPFTDDLEVCRKLLGETEVGMAGPRTAIGDAIGLALRLFEESEVERKVLILLTDGNDTTSAVPPVNAARIASEKGITIHPIAFGDPASTGEEAFDEETLKTIASDTGGRYFRASDAGELEGIYAEIDRLDTREIETISHRPRRDLFHWFLAGVLLVNTSFLSFLLIASRASNRSRARAVAALRSTPGVSHPGGAGSSTL